MGCCPSTLHNSTQRQTHDPYPPPMPPHEDVKEVLTENQMTPMTSKRPTFDPVKDQSFRSPKKLESYTGSKLPLPPTKDRDSQICSRSKRFVSTSDYSSSNAALPRTLSSKSDARRSNYSRPLAKRPDARMNSPGSLGTAARRNVRRPRDQSPGHTGPARVVDRPKADLGERSGRRSRSPAKRVVRTESGRLTDPSPGCSGRLMIPKGGGEHVENPPVSLECFIFL